MINCSKCGAKWEAGIVVDKCPFCGAPLTIPDNSYSATLSGLIERYGMEVSYTRQFAEMLKDHYMLMNIVVNKGVGGDIVSIGDESATIGDERASVAADSAGEKATAPAENIESNTSGSADDTNADEEDMIIDLEYDDDTSIKCKVLGTFDANNKEYIALEPQDGSGDVYIYGYKQDGDEFEILEIESSEEFDAAAAVFNDIMN